MAGASCISIATHKVQVCIAGAGWLLTELCLCLFLIGRGFDGLCRGTFRRLGGKGRRRVYSCINNLSGFGVRIDLRYGVRVAAELFFKFVAAGSDARARCVNEVV